MPSAVREGKRPNREGNMLHTLLSALPTPPTGTPATLARDALDFLSVWIARIGGIVAFIGAVKFALSIKTEDAREQIQAVLVMVSGFMIVAAVTNLGDIFAIPAAGGYTPAAIDAQFRGILTFIGRWVGITGGLAMFIGGIMFGLAIRDNNAATKLSGVKTVAAGGITASVALLLPTFAGI